MRNPASLTLLKECFDLLTRPPHARDIASSIIAWSIDSWKIRHD